MPAYILNQPIKNEFNDFIKMDKLIPLKEAVESVEKLLIAKTLKTTSSYSEAAKILGVDTSTVFRKAKKYNVAYK
ncbi:MAG: hypothetical protein GX790_00785 [Syntrophomonadaceae bacterium]|nr:hypothetical protein [Syntrophomonadaceae bacterium]